MSQIILEHVTKNIKGKTILNDISYRFESGKIYGLHGRNGSGKTMLLRAIAGLIIPNSGTITVNGKRIGKDIEFPESIGIIIENMTLLPDYTAFENLKFLAKIKKTATDTEIRHALEVVGLDAGSSQKVKAFSLGMKQKLNIAQAIFENPDILLLDEPTNALDEETIQDIRAVLLNLKEEGKIIIIASHNKDDLEILSDEVLEIKEGTLKKEKRND